MSGGPYGRGKAPERECMKRQNWPERDRILWEAALAPDLFGDGGSRADKRMVSNLKAEKGYGRWLTFLKFSGLLDADVHPADRITRERVLAYVEALRGFNNGTQTQLARLQELGEVAVVIDNERDWGFIGNIAARVRANHKPVRDKREKMVCTVELYELGLDLMAGAGSESTLRQQAVTYRDGLVIAFLALAPYRRKNLADVALDRTLLCSGETWLVDFPAEAMKNGDPRQDLWPEPLIHHLQTYLKVHRPTLASATGRWARDLDGALWVSTDGSPLTEMALYDRIRARTAARFGFPVSPHAFRHAAATTWAVRDPASVRGASSLLGHRSPQTTDRYYQMALSIDAGRVFTNTLVNRGRTTDSS